MLDWSANLAGETPVRTCIFSYVSYVGLLLAPAVLAGQDRDRAYQDDIETWRKNYEADLKQDNGWLALVGLYWLEEGDNSFGTDLANKIVLPEDSAPKFAGMFRFRYGKTRLQAKEGVTVLLNGKPVLTEMPVFPDTPGKPDRITLGGLAMIVIKRANRFGIRVWNSGSPARANFAGTRWYPVNESYRIDAQFIPYSQPKPIPILNVLGDTEDNPSPGYATFQLQGKQCRLEPLVEDNRLFFIFKDLTSGKQTYPAGRFLYAAMPKDGRVILDFNKAENPPCAFTAYATCPLPPKQNNLPVSIEAGEMNDGHAKP